MCILHILSVRESAASISTQTISRLEEELNRKRQCGQSVSAPVSPFSGDNAETSGCNGAKTGSTSCCSGDPDGTPLKAAS